MEREVKGLTMTVKFNENDVMGMVQKLKEQGKLKAVVHAHWVDHGAVPGSAGGCHSFSCSSCRWFNEVHPAEINRQRFCWHCGAEMDEGEPK